MDMFMDKLAQKLNAQEIIKANTAADTKEMNKLKNQIEEYNECLDRLKKLVEEGEAAFKNAQASRQNIDQLTEESILKIRDIQDENAGLQELGDRLKHLEKGVEKLLRNGEEAAETARVLEENAREKLESIEKAVYENVHKECVKVYRNVQAVVTEAGGKVTEETGTAVKAVSGRIGTLLGISVAALVFSLASVALQILNLLNIKFF